MDKVVAFMPIRLNSKRITNKSIRKLGGRPLFCWLLQEMDRLSIPVYVYCSNPEYLKSHLDFESANIRFMERPIELDDDEVKGIDIYRQFKKDVPAEIYLLCHCTSPFITKGTLEKVMNPVVLNQVASCLTVRKIQTFIWYQGKALNFSLPRMQTQKLEPIYVETSAAYCYRAEILDKGDRSDNKPEFIILDWKEEEDIDNESDFVRCEAILSVVKQ